MADDDERWLIGPDAEPYLQEAAAATGDELAVITRLRKLLTAERARLIVEQTTLRKRARTKFAYADRMFFTPLGLEQATDEVTANYKAARFPARQPVVDFCCGIGGDLLSLGQRGPTVGIDRAPIAALRAAANCQVHGSIYGEKFLATVEASDVVPERVVEFAAWHIDPDRRPAGRRTTRTDLHEPSTETLDELLDANPRGAIKLAPAADLPISWSERCEAEWISRRGECKQLVAWFGELAQRPGERRATAVADDGTFRTFVGRGDLFVPSVERLGPYLFEPDAAVLAAELTGAITQQYQIAAVHPGSVYLTGDAPFTDALVHSWEVLEEMPFDLRRVRSWLTERGVGSIELKKRGIDVDLEKLRRDLPLTGNAASDASVGLILVRRGDRVSAVFARRVVDL